MALRPNHDLLVVTWLRTLSLTADGIGTDLPATGDDWEDHGFIQISTVGGSPMLHTPIRQPSVQVDVWANRAGSELPPWNKAGHLCEEVFAVFEDFGLVEPVRAHTIVTPAGYNPVRIMAAWPETEPRRMEDDPSSYARYTFDAAVRWVAA